MPTDVKELTERRKTMLLESGKGKNSLGEFGEKPSGPSAATMEYLKGSPFTWAAIGGGATLGALCAYEFSKRKGSDWLGGVYGLAASGLLYYGISDLLGDDMTPEDIGMEHPDATVLHRHG